MPDFRPKKQKMNNQLFINDLTVFGENFDRIGKAMTLLVVYTQLKNNHNIIQIRKDDLARELSKSRRTINAWVKILCRTGAIKYKTSGKAFINPYYYYNGPASDYVSVQEEWKNFKSDIH